MLRPRLLCMSMRSKRTLVAILLIAAVTLLVWRLLPPQVLVAKPVRGPAVEAVYATGTVEPTVMLPIAPRISARIEELKVDEGAFVRAGDLLARLDDAEPQANLSDLSTQEALAKQEADRLSRLIERQAVPQVDFDRAQSRLLSVRAARKAAEVRLSYLTLLAPSDGVVIRRDGEIGQLVPVNQPIFWYSGNEPLRISAEVDEEDIPRIKVAQRVLIRADAFADKVFEGKVESITPKGDPVSRSFRVRMSFGTETPLRIGMTAETNIIVTESKEALLVPSAAIQDKALWVLDAGLIHKRTVDIGARGSEQTEIRSGLSENEIVLLDPSDQLIEGMRARGKFKG